MMKKLKIKSYLWISCLSYALLSVTTVHAAPGILANEPLFAGSTTTTTSSGGGVPSNVFFQIDDSGSMDWDTLTKKYWTACLYDPQNAGILAGKTCPGLLQVDGNLNIYTQYTSSGSTYYDFREVDNLTNFTTSTITSYMNYEWRIRAAQMNTIFYDPAITYTPWKKGNADGSSCDPASFTAAKDRPTAYDCGNAATQTTVGTTNLTGFVFEIAHDTHGYFGTKPSISAGGTSSSKKVGTVTTTTIKKGINRIPGANGMVDFWDEHTRYTVNSTGIVRDEIKYNPTPTTATAGTATCIGSTPSVSPAGYATVTGCGTNNVTVTINNSYNLNPTIANTATLTTGLNGRTLDEEKQNIANWYQYYRQRVNIAKAAVGEVIDANPNYRYGYSTIWNKDFVEVPSQYDPPASTTVRTDFITHNKNLLKILYARNPSGSTPLPPALDRVGRYFMHQSLPPLNSTTIGASGSITYTDPITYECQQNFAILQTDGYWNTDLGTTSQALIQDADGDGIGSTSDTTSSQQHSTVADVARYYYNTDLSALANHVPTTLFDPNSSQHMVTYTVAFGLDGYLTDTSGDGWPDYNTKTGTTGSWLENSNWGDPSGGSDIPDKIDDLWHAAYNARGLYVSAGAPDKIAAGFKHIFESIGDAQPNSYSGSATAVTFNGTTFVPSVSAAYLASFSKSEVGSWSGDVLSYSFNQTTHAVNPTPDWRASDLLDARVDATTKLITNARTILTYNNSTGKGIPFQWANLTANQQNDLLTGATATKAQARLKYLRGDRNNEGVGENFRVREHLLGDIIHSDPVIVRKPIGYWPAKSPFFCGTQSYSDFKATTIREGMVYAGANDGMLHGFRAADGFELMAYIPNTVFSANTNEGLHYLTDPAYTHRYYVDMPAIAGDACLNSAWRTVLIGGEMGGGRGIFALDVTNPSDTTKPGSFSEANAADIALWEFDSTDDKDMGYSFATPSIAMMPNGRWAVIFGNGYNNGGTGKAALFIVFLDPDLSDGWTGCTIGTGVGTSVCTGTPDYIKIMAPASGDPATTAANCTTLTTCNGLSTPQPYSTKQNNITDRVYAGDLKGNMWAFDVSSTNPGDWKVAYGTDASPKPLFTATYHAALTVGGVPSQKDTKPQPITTRPAIVKNAKAAGSAPNLMILFGTGQYLINGDPNTTDTQSFYGVWDHGFSEMTPATLVEQTFLPGPFYDNKGVDVTNSMRVLSKNPVPYIETYPDIYDPETNTSAKKCLDETIALSTLPNGCIQAKDATNQLISRQGWLINFTKIERERLGVDPDVVDDKDLFFNTWIPGVSSSASVTPNTDLCAPTEISTTASGSGYKMAVDLFTGSATTAPAVDTNSNGKIGSNDLIKQSNVSYVVAGQVFTKGLPASSTFFDDRQYVLGTSNSNISPVVSDAVQAVQDEAQADVDSAKAAKDVEDAFFGEMQNAIDHHLFETAADLIKTASLNPTPENIAAAQAAIDALPSKSSLTADYKNVLNDIAEAVATNNAANAAKAAAEAAKNAASAAEDAAEALKEVAADKAKKDAIYKDAQKWQGKATAIDGGGSAQNVRGKIPMSRISWQELRKE
jgi:type IV pilus assembly protein PilY1